MSPRVILVVGLALASAGPELPAQPAEARARAEMDGLRSALERAMGKATGILPAGLAPGHAYHLKGYGAVIVLSPRPLAVRRVRRVVRGEGARGGEGARALAQAQREFAQSLAELQEQGLTEVEGPLIDVGALEREMELQMAAQAEAMQRLEVEQQEWTRQGEDVLRRQIRMFEEQAEAFRRAAERARVDAERSVRERLAPPALAVVAAEAPPRPPP